MMVALHKYADYAYALLRMVAGFLLACHGAQKLFGMLGGEAQLGNPLQLTAGVIEFFGGILIALGLATRLPALLASVEMAVTYFKLHAKRGFFPIQNHGENVVLFLFVFLFICLRGAGPLSFDSLFRRHRN